VNIEVATTAFPANEVDGGQHLSNGCTSAFTAKNSGGSAGVLSAAHCPDSASGYTFGSQVESGSVDAQSHRTTGVFNKIRHLSSGATKVISGYYKSAAGASVCNYGASTGSKCSTVYSTATCWPGLGCGFISVSGSVTAGGDSGGPWHSGSSAVGVHKGTAFIGLANRSVFTYVGNALASLGLSLCTASYCGIV
jgi:hypothetical protein